MKNPWDGSKILSETEEENTYMDEGKLTETKQDEANRNTEKHEQIISDLCYNIKWHDMH